MKKILLTLLVIFLVGCTGESTNLDLEPKDLPNPGIGPEDAKIVVVEYSDFQCPYCAAAAGLHDQLVPNYERQIPGWEAPVTGLKELAQEGKIRFEFKHFPLPSHKNAFLAAQAAEAANAQGKFWEYHDLLYANQNTLTRKNLIKFAEQLELDVELFTKELDSEVYAASVRKDLSEGQRDGVKGTPVFLVNGESVPFLVGSTGFKAKVAEIEAQLAPEESEEMMEDSMENQTEQ